MTGLGFQLVTTKCIMEAAFWPGHGCILPCDECGLGLGSLGMDRAPSPKGTCESKAR